MPGAQRGKLCGQPVIEDRAVQPVLRGPLALRRSKKKSSIKFRPFDFYSFIFISFILFGFFLQNDDLAENIGIQAECLICFSLSLSFGERPCA